MVEHRAKLDATFAALSDPTRRAILSRLARGELSVGELAEPFGVSLQAVSKHLGVLHRAGLLVQNRQGRVRRCRLRPTPMKEASAWIERHRRLWAEQLDALAEFVEQTDLGSSTRPENKK